MTPAETDAPGAAPDVAGARPDVAGARPDAAGATPDAAGARPDELRASELRATILALAAERGPAKTICPSEAARALAGSNEKAWRLLMKPIRAQAVRLAEQGLVEIRRKGRAVDPREFKGVYRIVIRS